ncbi:hypothetical protein L6452_23591 [Arctium lappa]|uniref:Uncharacterized protein n=1 Tax=Arctium lappa TaxID=4217 RepID=A0ACB9B2C6_ARCLA|nr:hypothetical protein L6452_23591 [Arctium lappa]
MTCLFKTVFIFFHNFKFSRTQKAGECSFAEKTSLKVKATAKEIYLNRDEPTIEKLLNLLGGTMGPKGQTVVLTSDDGSLEVMNHGLDVANRVKPRDTVESIGAKLMRHVTSSTHDLVGDGTSTSIVFAQGLINEGVKAVTTGADPVEMTKGMERTMRALVKELKSMSRNVKDDYLADVVKRNTRNNNDIGNMMAKAKSKVGNKCMVALEVGKTKKECLHLVEGLHYGRRHISPCFVIDSGNNYSSLIRSQMEGMLTIFEDAKNGGYPLLIIVEDIQEDDVHTLVMNKPLGSPKIAVLKATGVSGTVIRKEVDLRREALGFAAQVVLTKQTTMIVGDRSTQGLVNIRAAKIKELVESADMKYQRQKVKQRLAKVSQRFAIIQAVTTGGVDPIEMTKGMERTMRALVKELKRMSRKVKDDYLADVVKRNTRNNNDIGNVIAKAKSKVGNKGVVALEVGKIKKKCLHLVEGLHYGRCRLSPCFVIDSGNKLVEYENCKVIIIILFVLHIDQEFFSSSSCFDSYFSLIATSR